MIFLLILYSCINRNELRLQDSEIKKYESAYNSITNKMNKEQPFLNEFQSNASGVKIIPKLYKLTNYSIYGSEHFKNEKSSENSELKNLSKKHSQINWRKDKNFKVLKIEELKNFHGPLKYIYFSEIKNDSLRADILANPFAEYSMTTGEHYLIIFESNYIKSVQKTISHFE